MTITPQELNDLDRLEKAATPGEVVFLTKPKNSAVLHVSGRGIVATVSHYSNANDLYYLAAARNAMPGLLARLRELETAAADVCQADDGGAYLYQQKCGQYAMGNLHTALIHAMSETKEHPNPYEVVSFDSSRSAEWIGNGIAAHAWVCRENSTAFMVQLRAELDKHIRNEVAEHELIVKLDELEGTRKP